MDSSPPPNLALLNQFFNNYDSDHDGKVTDQEIENILLEVGFDDVYIGTIRKIIRLLNAPDSENKKLTFPQLLQYAEAMTSKGKFKLWKATLQTKAQIDQMILQVYGSQSNQAAPGASPGGAPGSNPEKALNHQDGEIAINIGNAAQYPQYFSFSLEKQKGQSTKPFIRLSVQRNSTEQAKQLQTSLKAIYDVFIEILKSEQQALIPEILSVSFDTKVEGNLLTMTLSTENQDLIQYVQLYAEALDKLMKSEVNGKIEGSYRFDFDFEKFISDPNYNFYDILVKNSSFNLKWNVWNLFQSLRLFALKAQFFEDLRWDMLDPLCLFLITLLHTEKFTGRLQFDNTQTSNQEIQSKKSIVETISEIRNMLLESGQDMNLDFVQMLQHLQGKISLEAGVKDWRFRFELQITGISKVFTNEIKPLQKQQFPQQSWQESHQDDEENETKPQLKKDSSQKQLKKNSSCSSLKKSNNEEE